MPDLLDSRSPRVDLFDHEVVILVRVEVAVATKRPPRHDRTSQVLVEADNELEAGLIAMAMASGHRTNSAPFTTG